MKIDLPFAIAVLLFLIGIIINNQTLTLLFGGYSLGHVMHKEVFYEKEDDNEFLKITRGKAD